MSRALITVRNEEDRVKAAKWIAKAPPGTNIEFTLGDKRTLSQNDRMWAMFTDISQQLTHINGRKYTKEEWCDIFWDGFRKETTMAPDLYGIGVVSLRRRTSSLKTDEMTAFMEFIVSEAIPRGVKFRDDPMDHIADIAKPVKSVQAKLTRAEVMAKAREAKKAKAALAVEKPAGEPFEVRIALPKVGEERASRLPQTEEGYIAYAHTKIKDMRNMAPSIMENWFLSQEQARLRQDCKVGNTAVQLLHSLIKELCGTSETVS